MIPDGLRGPGVAVREDAPLAERTTLRIGGPARYLAEVADIDALSRVLRFADQEALPVLVLGKGSNLLVPDAGFPGVALVLGGAFRETRVEGTEIAAGGGVSLMALAAAAKGAGLSGVENLSGIPSSVGGAVRINAGSYGSEIFDVLVSATCVSRTGDTRVVPAARIPHGYRWTALCDGDEVVAQARLSLKPKSPAEIAARMTEVAAKRRAALPKQPNAGSIFKNPPGLFAGKLLEACGLKGRRIGGAEVSSVHANVIVNTGRATAQDVRHLMEEMKRAVHDRFGVELQPEIQIVNPPDPYNVPMADASVRALILAGGSGTRLWPRSTDTRPKPFLALAGGESLLRATFRRAAAVAGEGKVYVSGRASHAPLLRAALPEVPESRLVLEPTRRDTAPAIALSALVASQDDASAVLLVLPSDQAVRDETMFLAALRAGAMVAAKEDAFVTLGIPPTRAETGYGYMEVAEEHESRVLSSARRVARFVEKPDAARAAEFLASGRFLWNAGIFLFRASLLFEEMQRVCPNVLDAARRAYAARKAGALSSFEEIFSSSPSVSIDVGVMEKAKSVLTIPCPCGWSDLGSWEAVFEFRGGAPGADVVEGDGACEGGSGNLVLAGARPVRVVGLSGVAVVESPDGLLVMRLGASDDLRKAVEKGLAR